MSGVFWDDTLHSTVKLDVICVFVAILFTYPFSSSPLIPSDL